jgi:hypothetical protein
LIEEVMIFVTAILWTSIASIVCVTFLWIEDRRKELMKNLTRNYLWFVMIFTAGSVLFVMDDTTWANIFATLASHSGELKLIASFGTWTFGLAVVIYFLNEARKRLG